MAQKRRSRRKANLPTAPEAAASMPTADPVERISADDFSYHQRAIRQLKERQAGLQAAELVLHEWAAHLVEKYKILETDLIQEDGSIVRGKVS